MLGEVWAETAACRQLKNPDDMFVQGAAQHRVKNLCNQCQVRNECLAEALDNQTEFGVWGGMTERERRILLRRRSDISSWKELLKFSRAKFDEVTSARRSRVR
ncbi:MAG: WhiB family transcriptional regulator [Candidatus Nanopelagicales bacterium]